MDISDVVYFLNNNFSNFEEPNTLIHEHLF